MPRPFLGDILWCLKIPAFRSRSNSEFRFEDHRLDTNARFNELRSDMNSQFEALRTELRAETSRLFTLTLSIAVGMAGVMGAMIVDKLA